MIKAAIIGTGNIGTDLLFKIVNLDFIKLVAFVGRRESSDGIKEAQKKGTNTSYEGIDFFIKNRNYCDVVFDCTDAISAIKNNSVFQEQNIKVIDLTPSKIGEMCIPIINGGILQNVNNINMVTCGGQASIPILNLFYKIYQDIEYIEVVSQISSKSAGLATRLNLDQYIETTELAIKKFTNCKSCKVILNLNPAEPCVDMQTTMFLKINERQIQLNNLIGSLNKKIEQIKKIVPGYELTLIPIINDEGILILSIKVVGRGDYLPAYSGNLDIITCAAIEAIRYIQKDKSALDILEDNYE